MMEKRCPICGEEIDEVRVMDVWTGRTTDIARCDPCGLSLRQPNRRSLDAAWAKLIGE